MLVIRHGSLHSFCLESPGDLSCSPDEAFHRVVPLKAISSPGPGYRRSLRSWVPPWQSLRTVHNRWLAPSNSRHDKNSTSIFCVLIFKIVSPVFYFLHYDSVCSSPNKIWGSCLDIFGSIKRGSSNPTQCFTDWFRLFPWVLSKRIDNHISIKSIEHKWHCRGLIPESSPAPDLLKFEHNQHHRADTPSVNYYHAIFVCKVRKNKTKRPPGNG